MERQIPFFENRRKRAGLIRRVGNLADKLTGIDPDLRAMQTLAVDENAPKGEVAHLKEMMASQLRFVSPLTLTEARKIALTVGITSEFANQAAYLDRPDLSPQTMRAAFDDVAVIARKNLE